MFQDLDTTLKNLFPPQDPAATTFLLLRAADKSFLTPDKTFAPGQNTIDLFLYDVKENRELRDNTPILIKTGTTFTRLPPPVRLDCSYIVTAWSNVIGDVKVAAEHQLLSEALQWLSRFPIIPANVLAGSMVDPVYPPTLLVAQVDPNKNAGDFWFALGIAPRPAFYVTVTLAVSIGLSDAGPLVTTHSTNVAGDSDWVQVGGQVLDAATATPIAGTIVELIDLGTRTTSGADGRYAFPRVPAGVLKMRATAVGYQPLSMAPTVPGRPEDYNFSLKPLP